MDTNADVEEKERSRVNNKDLSLLIRILRALFTLASERDTTGQKSSPEKKTIGKTGERAVRGGTTAAPWQPRRGTEPNKNKTGRVGAGLRAVGTNSAQTPKKEPKIAEHLHAAPQGRQEMRALVQDGVIPSERCA